MIYKSFTKRSAMTMANFDENALHLYPGDRDTFHVWLSSTFIENCSVNSITKISKILRK